MKLHLRCIVITLFLLTAGTMLADTYVVTGNTINVRAKPSMKGEVVGKLHKGDRITVTEIMTVIGRRYNTTIVSAT